MYILCAVLINLASLSTEFGFSPDSFSPPSGEIFFCRRKSMKDIFDTLEKHIGLNQTLEVDYVVDGYEAALMCNSCERTIVSAHGETLKESLENLCDKMISNKYYHRCDGNYE